MVFKARIELRARARGTGYFTDGGLLVGSVLISACIKSCTT